MYNELYHHGVLGMKWGVRRYQPYSTVPRGSGEGGKEIGEAKKLANDITDATLNGSRAKEIENIRNTSKTDEQKDRRLRELDIDSQLEDAKIVKQPFNYGNNTTVFSSMDIQEYPGGPKITVTGTDISDEALKSSAKDFLLKRGEITEMCKDAVMEDKWIYSWGEELGMSRDEFRKAIDVKSISIYDDNTAEIHMWEKNDSTDILGGHSIDAEIDLKNPKKPDYVAMNG